MGCLVDTALLDLSFIVKVFAVAVFVAACASKAIQPLCKPEVKS